jgi:adenylylsulfate kinase-like enzyme
MSRAVEHAGGPSTRQQAPVVWITGLSGTGKSTTARALQSVLAAEGCTALLLDGDEFRAAVSDDLGHSPADRLTNALRLVRFAGLSSRQGVVTIVATMSLFAPVYRELRSSIPNLRLVYLHSPIDVLARRDPKRLYAEVSAGQRQYVVGVDLPFDAPPDPDLSLDTSNLESCQENVRQIRFSLAKWLPITST